VGGSLAFAQGGAVVEGGAATIAQQGADLNVTTHTDRTVIKWDSFNINAGHTANFNQPGVNSAVLNRVVTPNNPSGIYGTLNSNGNVYLVNPSGVIVGPSGGINTNGFTASVPDISSFWTAARCSFPDPAMPALSIRKRSTPAVVESL